MNRKTLDELASGHALGALDAEAADQLEAWLSSEPRARGEVAAFIDTAAAMAIAASTRVEPNDQLRAQILANVAMTPQKRNNVATVSTLPLGYSYIAHSDEGWAETDVPGFRTKLLSSGPHPGHLMMLVAFDPGTTYGHHDHGGIEELYMISGHLHTEDLVLGPGDFMRGEMGTHHRECHSPDGCVALLICHPGLVAETVTPADAAIDQLISK